MILRRRTNRTTRRRHPLQRESVRPRLETLEQRLVLDATVVINEIMYNPAGAREAELEWIELYNQLVVDVDISEWQLDGAVDYTFPDGTTVPGRGYLVVAANPTSFQEAYGKKGALGPWTGQLANGGEEIRLYNNDERLMNVVDYGDSGDWPTAPDGGGASLSKFARESASHLAENWTYSKQLGGTPGSVNFVLPGDIQYETILADGADVRAMVPKDGSLGLSWTQSAFDDSQWLRGKTGVGHDDRTTYEPYFGLDLDAPPDGQTPQPMRDVNGSVYMRIPFEFSGDPNTITKLDLGMRFDDGFVAFLNGVEVASANAPGRDGAAGELSWDSTATRSNSDTRATSFASFVISQHASLLKSGANLLAIQGLNTTATDADALYSPQIIATLALPPTQTLPLAFNEIDGEGSATFFVELQNDGDTAINLQGIIIRSSDAEANDYVLGDVQLAPGGFHTVTAQQLGYQPEDNDRLFLISADGKQMIDSRRVTPRLRGRVAAQDGLWGYPASATPGAENLVQLHDEIVINEISYHPQPKLAIPDILPTYETTEVVSMTADGIRYNDTGAKLPSNWAQQVYPADGQQWKVGKGLIGYETSTLDFPIGTEVTRPSNNDPGFTTYYFQTDFDVTAQQLNEADIIQLRHMIDDGAVFYLNGQEFARFNMPAGEITADTSANSPQVRNAELLGPIDIARELLQVGKNVLSVEVHNGSTVDSDIVYGAQLTLNKEITPLIPGEPYTELSNQEWIELHNRSDREVDLSGWQMRGGARFDFPAGARIAPGGYVVVANDMATFKTIYPDVPVVGEFAGNLSDHDDRIRLYDNFENLADDVHYYEGGYWPSAPDGGGSTLELADPRSDNNAGESWRASDESSKSKWTTYTFSDVSREDIYGTRATYNEFLFGLLDDGEFLIDDIVVVQNPDAEALSLIQNGTFENDAIGTSPDKWRLIGNHSGVVVADPTNPANKVLHVTSTGAMGFVHDHAETTFVNDTDIRDGNVYSISFRAKWVSGNRQLNNRLWFNRLPGTLAMDSPSQIGTPGARNGAYTENVGPTFTGLRHGPTTPAENQPVTVQVQASDPDGVTQVNLHWRPDRGQWSTLPMTLEEDGFYRANIPGQGSGDIVQFYVSANDSLEATANFPALGVDSRALYQVEDNIGPSTPIDRIRLILMNADSTTLFRPENRMSNWQIPGTLIHNDTPYYDIGTRQTGSRFIRPNSGYKVELNPATPFYGVHDTIRLDLNGMTEIVMKQMINRAGGTKSSMYDDLAYLVAPNRSHSHEILLNLSRYENSFLDEQFENGSDGTKWELDDVTVPTSPRGGVEGIKVDTAVNESRDIGGTTSLVREQGLNPEFYRAHLLIKSNRAKDDFQAIVRLANAIHQDGQALFEATNEVMDVDLWMRHYADQAYLGNWDTYGYRRPKNLRIYSRPSDDKLIPLFWDCDLCNFTETIKNRSEATSRLDEIREIPHNLRLFWGHMLDFIDRSFNREYVEKWAAHYGGLINNQLHGGASNITFASIAAATATRSTRAIADMERDIPRVEFQITTNDGNPMTVDEPTVTLHGKGWVDIRQIRLAGSEQPLDVFWPEKDGWEITLPLALGQNTIELEAYGYRQQLISTQSIEVTSTVGDPIADSLRISEVHYNPSDPTASEMLAGFNDNDDFEFIEIMNIGAQPISLDDVAFVRVPNGNNDEGVEFQFSSGSVRELLPRQTAVIVEDVNAFRARYGNETLVAGQWSGGLDNGGEKITVTSKGVVVLQFTYDDAWYPDTDGEGRSLQVNDVYAPDLDVLSSALGWRPSSRMEGSPGGIEPVPGDANGDGVFDSKDLLATMQSGEYEDLIGGNSTFAEGDFNGDGDFTSADFIWAFTYGVYVGAPAAHIATIEAASDAVFALETADQRRRPGDHQVAVDSLFEKADDDRESCFELEGEEDRGLSLIDQAFGGPWDV